MRRKTMKHGETRMWPFLCALVSHVEVRTINSGFPQLSSKKLMIASRLLWNQSLVETGKGVLKGRSRLGFDSA